MLWFRKIPWLSISIMTIAYGVSGWLYAAWAVEIINQGKLFYWILENNIITVILYGLGICFILLIALAFTAPVAFLTTGMAKWFRTDFGAFMSIILGAMAFALIVQRLDFFSRIFVLLASAMLVRIELKIRGIKTWISSLIIACLCLLGFGIGIIAHINLLAD